MEDASPNRGRPIDDSINVINMVVKKLNSRQP